MSKIRKQKDKLQHSGSKRKKADKTLVLHQIAAFIFLAQSIAGFWFWFKIGKCQTHSNLLFVVIYLARSVNYGNVILRLLAWF